ncbi:MAG: hypothetical protein KDB60_05215 [Propionibacteriaceae bacterium]|nr:hypothetical protein [Propionibacteriaceae bacterium]
MTTTPTQAVSDPTLTAVTATTPDATVNDTGIDEWELAASRRILANLRTLLDGQQMLDLIKDQVDESDRQLKEYIEQSHGEFTGTQVILQVSGIHVQQFMPTVQAMMGGAASPDPAVRGAALTMAFAAHPEHYAMAPGGRPGVIETMGGLPTRSFPAFVQPDQVPDFVSDLIDSSYDLSTVGAADLADGTMFSYVLQEYRDTADGMQVSLRIWYPAACPPAYVEEHAQHYAVEFRNGARLAAAALRDRN